MNILKLRQILIYTAIIIFISAGGLVYYEINSENKAEYLTILHTNDVHGRLEPIEYKDHKGLVGGIARRAKIIKDIKNTNNNVMVVDAGDFAQGTLFFNFFDGIPDAKLMNQIGYDVAIPGNHEFDKKLDTAKKIIKNAEFPFVCANIAFTEDEELQKLIRPYIIKNYNGLKVAVSGILTEDLKTLVNNLDGVEVFNATDTAKNIVEELSSKADLIIFLTHMGSSKDIQLAKNVDGIDVIIGGHTHTLFQQPEIVNNTLILQAGEFGVYVGKLDLEISGNKIKDHSYRLIPVDDSVKADETIEEKVKILSQKLDKYRKEKIGEIDFTIGENRNIRATLQKEGALVVNSIKNAFPDTDIVLQNSGGIRLQKVIEPGDISVANILTLFPFENTVVTLELKGSDLKSVLETSSRTYPQRNGGFLQSLGLEYVIDTDKTNQILSRDGSKIEREGNRVSDIKINGQPLKEDKYYKIAINDYMFNGGNGYSQFKNGINPINTGVKVQDLIIEYIKQNSPVSIEIKDKIKVPPALIKQ